ncbi:hypothetical protein BD626DRAFT_548983 [Schizophyllum amplum]|uniref:Uncharacterized protein n=1 Tax=Schizophyllum amplum TaxID=97359 RepID=A0A550CAL2_9AGAR|nr:hypothetical protein BD626DRAFT_548983 [Auriculariopsis ampla]
MLLAAPSPIALPCSDPFVDTTPRSSSSLCFPTQLSPPRTPQRVKHAPARLQSPIRLAEPGLRSAPLPYQTRSSMKKRNQRIPSRRQRPAEPIFKSNLTSFDELPWVAALQSECAAYSCHVADMADLSQLDVERSGAGPVRRRKTSLRTSPMAVHRQQLPTPAATPERDELPPAFPFVASPTCSTPHRAHTPVTPVKRSSYRATDRVIFRHLMPLLSAPEHDAGPGIIRL